MTQNRTRVVIDDPEQIGDVIDDPFGKHVEVVDEVKHVDVVDENTLTHLENTLTW